jgi:DNA-directed RNA polymerase subunit RPC12/RpoP
MQGIYLAEVLTIGLAVAIFGTVLRKLRLPANGRLVWLAGLMALPLQPLAFYFVRVPLDHWMAAHLDPSSAAYAWLKSLYAPLTEEPAKLVPLLIPAIFRDIRRENFVRYALAIGTGFAIGEMWFVADRVARMPEYAGLPFWQFGGYMGERLMTCVFHSAFVAVALWRLRRRFVVGFAGAAALHWLGNFPIFLMAWDVGGLGKGVWSGIVFGFLLLYFFAALALLSYFTFGRLAPGRIFYGIRRCPECEKDYDAPLFGLNFGTTRYERCPHCRHWHWTKPRKV